MSLSEIDVACPECSRSCGIEATGDAFIAKPHTYYGDPCPGGIITDAEVLRAAELALRFAGGRAAYCDVWREKARKEFADLLASIDKDEAENRRSASEHEQLIASLRKKVTP